MLNDGVLVQEDALGNLDRADKRSGAAPPALLHQSSSPTSDSGYASVGSETVSGPSKRSREYAATASKSLTEKGVE